MGWWRGDQVTSAKSRSIHASAVYEVYSGCNGIVVSIGGSTPPSLRLPHTPLDLITENPHNTSTGWFQFHLLRNSLWRLKCDQVPGVIHHSSYWIKLPSTWKRQQLMLQTEWSLPKREPFPTFKISSMKLNTFRQMFSCIVLQDLL